MPIPNRVASPQEHDEAVAARDRQRGFDRRCDQLVVVPGTPDKTWPGRLAERRTEAQRGRRPGERLVKIDDRLDEVRLADDDVCVVWDRDGDGLKFHAP